MVENGNGSSPSGINVFLIAENRLLRETLARLLQKRAGIGVVGVSRGAGSAWKEIAASRCEIVLTDCLTSNRDTSLVSELFEHLPQIKVVLFGMDEDPDVFLKFTFLGVSGYVLKDASAAEIISAVRGVAQGEIISAAEASFQRARQRKTFADLPATRIDGSRRKRYEQ